MTQFLIPSTSQGSPTTWGAISGALSDQTDLKSYIDSYIINLRTGPYILTLSDARRVVEMNSANNSSITVPNNSSVAFPLGTIIRIANSGAGSVSIQGDTGVALRIASGVTNTLKQYELGALLKRGTNEWYYSPFFFSSNSSSGNDPYFSSVSLLLPFNGTNGSTIFTDLSSYNHIITRYGNTAIYIAQSKFGGASAYFDGNGDYLEVPGNTFRLETESIFTVEGWLRRNNTAQHGVFSTRGSTSSGWVLRVNADSRVIFFYTGGSSITSDITIGIEDWTHIAFVRKEATGTIYINGIGKSITSWSNGTVSSDPLRIGVAARDLNSPFNGYMDDLRITKGVARYINNFTPPTTAFPDN